MISFHTPILAFASFTEFFAMFACVQTGIGGVIESLVGVIFIDPGFDKKIVWENYQVIIRSLVSLETMEYHPVGEQNELCSCNLAQRNLPCQFKIVASGIIEVLDNGAT